MESYYFILGRENKISQTELQCVLASFDFGFRSEAGSSPISILSDQVLEIKLKAQPIEIAKLIDVLGGTVKIYQKIALVDEKLADILSKEDFSKKVIFGLSNYSTARVDTFRMALITKKAIKKSIRIVDGKEDGKLSSAQSFQYKMDLGNIEYGLFDTGIGKLIAVQNINEWTRHDYGKPKSDAKSGMLPPKLARMMVNIALGSAIPNSKLLISNKISNSQIRNSKLDIRYCDNFVVTDPFCGSGNVLIEAISIGYDVVGSDLSEKAVSDSKINIQWFLAEKKLEANSCQLKASISMQDATKFDFSTISQDFVVVTEPFLGQPRNSKLRIEEEAEAKAEISKLYLDFLRNLKLTADSQKLKAICLVFPLFELANGKKLSIFDNCVDFIRDIGYTTVCPPLEYGRDYQVVKRQIVLLRKKDSSYKKQ